MGFSENGAKGKIHSNTCLPQETGEKSDKKPNSTPKTTGKEEEQQQKTHI